jgi:uncharacterized protein YjbI with pentapeptide repeats
MTKPGIERPLILAVAFEPPLWITRTLCYNRKKDGENYYIYLSNKATSQVLLIGSMEKFRKSIFGSPFSEVHFRKSIFGSPFFGSPFSEVHFSEVHFRKSIFGSPFFGSQISEVKFRKSNFGSQISEVKFRKSNFRKSIFRKSNFGSQISEVKFEKNFLEYIIFGIPLLGVDFSSQLPSS